MAAQALLTSPRCYCNRYRRFDIITLYGLGGSATGLWQKKPLAKPSIRTMSNFNIISKLFHEHIEYLSLSADAIADVCDTVAAHLANALIIENKVFSIGVGLDSSTALSFCQLIREGVWFERPPLPIVELTATRAEPIGAGVSWVTRELNSLGQPGDVAVVWGSQLTPDDVKTLSSAAEQRSVQVFWVGTQGPTISLSFTDSDAQMRYSLSNITALTMARVTETHLFGA